MAVNKVIFGDETIIDISDTTAKASDVLSGKKFYAQNGEPVEGTYVPTTSGAECGRVVVAANVDYVLKFSKTLSYLLICTRIVGNANCTSVTWKFETKTRQTAQGTDTTCPNTARAGYIRAVNSDFTEFTVRANANESEIFWAGW